MRGRSLRWILGLASPLVAIAALAAFPGRVDLVVVSAGPEAVTVEVDGTARGEVPPGGVLVVRVTGGKTTLRALGPDGGEVERLEAVLPGERFSVPPARVWDVGGRTAGWWLLSKGYGDQVDAAPPPERWTPPAERPFAFPSGALERVDAPFDAELAVRRGTTGAVRRALWTEHGLAREHPRRVVVWVHNPSQAPVDVVAAGEPRGQLAPHGVLKLELPAGEVALEAVERGPDGQEGRRFTAEASIDVPWLASPPAWVWNVGRLAGRYLIVGRRFGGEPGQAPPPLEVLAAPAGALFPVPDGLEPGLDEPLPDTSPTAGVRRALVTERAFLARSMRDAGPPADVETLLRARALLDEAAAGGATTAPPAPPADGAQGDGAQGRDE